MSEIEFREIEGHRAIHLGNNYFGKNMLKDPIFKKWYKEEKNKINEKFRIDEDRNEILFFKNFKVYLYDTDRYANKIECCKKPDQRRVCIYCGNLFFCERYCCLRNSIRYSFREYLLDGLYFWSSFGKDFLKSIPIIFRFLFVKTVIKAFFFRRQKLIGDYDTYGEKETFLFKLTLKITFLIEITYIFVFYFPLTINYLFYSYFYFFQPSLNQFSKEY